MGISEQMGWSNPFTDFVGKNRNTMMGFGAGLAGGRNIGQGIAYGLQGAQSGKQMDVQTAQQDQQTNATKAYLTSKGWDDLVPLIDAGQANIALQEAMARSQPGYGQVASPKPMEINGQLVVPVTGQVIGDYRDPQGGLGSTEYGLTPIYGQFDDGTYGMGVVGKDGSFKQVDTGQLQVFDPRTLASERSAGTALGKAGGEATAAAPGDIAAGEAALSVLDQIEQSPELGWATGTSAGLGGNNVPGTGRFDFQNLVDQAKSGAFLIAVQQMRGLGALSNAEGGAATQAITRMNTATSTEAFKKALADYRAVIETGMNRARSRIGGGQQAAPQQAPREYTFNPATGRLE